MSICFRFLKLIFSSSGCFVSVTSRLVLDPDPQTSPDRTNNNPGTWDGECKSEIWFRRALIWEGSRLIWEGLGLTWEGPTWDEKEEWTRKRERSGLGERLSEKVRYGPLHASIFQTWAQFLASPPNTGSALKWVAQLLVQLRTWWELFHCKILS